MNKDVLILISAWVVTILLLIFFVPKNKIRQAHVIFLFVQVITWVTGLIVVQLGLIEYPVRSFSNAYKASFDFEYFIFPSICVIFNLHYPEEKGILKRFLYYSYYCSTITVIEVICEKFANIIKYIHWTWYITWITLFITFYISHKYYLWFFELKNKGKSIQLS